MLNLRDRTFCARRKTGIILSDVTLTQRAPKYKQWTDEQMQKAYKEVKDGKLSLRRAAEMYGILKSTLNDRVTGHVEFGSHSGPARYLTDREEQELVNFLCGCAKMGYAKTRKDVLAIVEGIMASKGKEVHISNGWWGAFKNRHPYLTLRTVEKLSYARSVATDETIINNYFDLLEQTIKDNNLADCPSQNLIVMRQEYHLITPHHQ